MPYEPLDVALQQMASCQSQLEGLAVALAPDELLGLSEQEAAARKELAGDALQLLEDTKAAIESGEPEDTLTSLVNATNRLAVQLRDRVLDVAVASSPVPEQWPPE
ncbi:hypothetical protein [Streptomyces capitiformicae]|uniref:hypothetical protein n=1 Tax=Streptomyces capitiformicae TaxID=2014920 RepID=UPI00167BB981|nr:hypothetical protein [Streptomyces capitiformicae]